MKNENLVPKVRFKGFSDPWEQRKLKDVSMIGSASRVHQGDWREHGIRFLRSSDIVKMSNREIVRNRIFIEKKLFNKLSAETGSPKTDDVLITGGGSIGTAYRITDDSPIYFKDADVLWIRTKNINGKFLVSYFKTNIFRKYLHSIAHIGTISHYTIIQLKNTPIQLPAYSEQNRIGDCFVTLNSLIAANEDKLEQLKTLKKLMMQKIFSQEWRFKGFTDPWEQRKLKNIAIRVRGNDGRMELPTLTISATQGWLNQKDRFSENIAGKEQKNYTLLKKGQLSYNHGNSKTAKYGAVFKLDIYTEALVPRVYHSFTVKHNNSADFIEYLFATGSPNRELRKLVSSGARMDGLLNISFDAFFNINLQVPIATEQMKIAKFFRKTDNLIAANEDKLNQLKKLKKYLMQNMFV
ncbi:restriction endonuclease subunit S [Lactiplantibacillus plantarum]|uniref:restriction endonuclease subunit S n=2 Tax=Lactiplantibacillus plantarum TaxID=1590 RepID=UPI0007B544FD|nr:restriction endonuclease subunit S [Lactiplantibacillus plantarum]KZU53201.1 Type I restriction-modification system specificity subunit S [Lactiplantibacillus plantarum]